MRLPASTLAVALVAIPALAAVAAPAAAEPWPEPQCMQVYQETNLGPVRVVRPDSCTTYVYVCDRTLIEAATSSDPLGCAGTVSWP